MKSMKPIIHYIDIVLRHQIYKVTCKDILWSNQVSFNETIIGVVIKMHIRVQWEESI
jgi:hypothetical protein